MNDVKTPNPTTQLAGKALIALIVILSFWFIYRQIESSNIDVVETMTNAKPIIFLSILPIFGVLVLSPIIWKYLMLGSGADVPLRLALAFGGRPTSQNTSRKGESRCRKGLCCSKIWEPHRPRIFHLGIAHQRFFCRHCRSFPPRFGGDTILYEVVAHLRRPHKPPPSHQSKIDPAFGSKALLAFGKR